VKTFTSLSEATLKFVYEDVNYGLGQQSTLYLWVRAMNEGASSEIYQEILAYFNG
jgi:hypothetical protein